MAISEFCTSFSKSLLLFSFGSGWNKLVLREDINYKAHQRILQIFDKRSLSGSCDGQDFESVSYISASQASQ